MTKRPWVDFQNIRSQSFVRDMMSGALDIAPDDLVDMGAVGGPISIVVAYAQDTLLFDASGRTTKVSTRNSYLSLPRDARVNKFGIAYRPEAKLWLHKTLAGIVIGAADYLYQTHGWTTVIYDGLRTVEGAYNLYIQAQDSDMDSGLLSMPGTSAHNKGLAVDSMMYFDSGREVPMGGHFDHLNMSTNGRYYIGSAVSAEAIENRRIREAAFLRSAFSQGLLIAPLRNEFWDDRLPENREDLWRVLDSAARAIGRSLLTFEDEALRTSHREIFAEKWENWDYDQFLYRWRQFFAKHENELERTIGAVMPPLIEKTEFYHGNYHPIYDEHLRKSGKHQTDELLEP
ncbi:MAG: hypothetical protein EBR02_08390 [Alphaproteobacteria bacterium]|nr:hypothetical protein [Alphaproteobacteria bacterium]